MRSKRTRRGVSECECTSRRFLLTQWHAEYFDWEPMQSGPARFAWLGNGRIQGELDEGADLAFYHRPR